MSLRCSSKRFLNIRPVPSMKNWYIEIHEDDFAGTHIYFQGRVGNIHSFGYKKKPTLFHFP